MYCTVFRDILQAWFAPRFDAPIEDASLSAYALYYASLGWHVFPLCTPGLDGRCTFHRRRGHPGKEPRIKGWPRKATTDVDTIKGWWHTWPGANIGLVTGRASGTFAVDIDPRRGGHYTLADLEAAHGRLPETVLAFSGGGGQHYYLKTPVCTLTGGNDALGPGIDVKADGGFIVAPPSRHVSGMRYEWEVSSRPGEVAVADPPGWLFAMLTEKGAPSSARARNKGVMDPSRLSVQRNPNGSPKKDSILGTLAMEVLKK
jgi:Bifunctional DNA primase/polymerase, N-terminal